MQFFRTLFRTGLSVPLHETTFTLISIQMEITFAAKKFYYVTKISVAPKMPSHSSFDIGRA